MIEGPSWRVYFAGDAVRANEVLGAATMPAVHSGTFQQGNDAEN